jgi:6-methylsalicylate decarboxylase
VLGPTFLVLVSPNPAQRVIISDLIYAHLSYMDANGISKSILSISSPGTHLTHDTSLTASLCREMNDYAAKLKLLHPTRFGFFASLPFPDVPESIAEIRRVRAARLDPDGFAILSNAAGIYLGDPTLRQVLEELNSEGGTVIFVHPTAPCRHGSVQASLPQPARYEASSPLATAYRAPMFEFFFDSAPALGFCARARPLSLRRPGVG